MRTWASKSARRTAHAALLTASFVALGAGSAYADTTSGDSSILGGNQVNAPISVPIDISGNAVGIIGKSSAGSEGGATAHNGGGGGQSTSGNSSVGGGNQVNAPISVPVNACGNAIAIAGVSDAGCKGGASAHNGGGGGQSTSGNGSVGGGNQVNAPIAAPVNVCGNAAALLGDAVAGCKGGAKVKNGGDGYESSGSGQRTSGNGSVIGGNQASSGASAPIDVCGNAVGNAYAGCEGGAKVKNSGSGQRTSGDGSVVGGNQANAPVSIPANVCGNAAALLGDAAAGCAGTVKAESSASSNRTSGNGSVIGGNQVFAPVKAPINACGNAVAAVGVSEAGCQGVVKSQSMSKPLPLPAELPVKLPKLPVTPGLPVNTGALPVNAGALPALPELPVQTPELPVNLPKLPVKAPVKAPAATALPVPLPVNVDPILGALPVNPAAVAGSLPVNPGVLPVQLPVKLPVKAPAPVGGKLPGPIGNPALAGGLPVLPQLPGTLGNLPATVGTLPAQLPKTPAGPVKKLPADVRHATHNPAPVTLPGLPALPVIGDVNLPVAGDHLDGRPVGKSSAAEPMSAQGTNPMYALGLAALLAAASAVMTVSRRIRRAHR